MGSGEQRQLNSIFHDGKSLDSVYYDEHSRSSNMSKGEGSKILCFLGKTSCLLEGGNEEDDTVLQFGRTDFMKLILQMWSIINFH